MNGLLVDVDLRGEGKVLLNLFRQPERAEIWEYLACVMPTFEELELEAESSDLVVWRACQEKQLVLLTANRNNKGQESLEWVLRNFNQPDCLPVLTMSRAEHFLPNASTETKALTKFLNTYSKSIGTKEWADCMCLEGLSLSRT